VAQVSTVLAGWSNERRRTSSFVILALALVIMGGALAAWWFIESTPEWLYWTLVGLLVLVLVFMVLLMVLKPRTTQAAEVTTATDGAPAVVEATEGTAPPPTTYEARVLTLRCGDCGTIFDVTDTGERPLYHTCPGCGAEGALRDPIEPAPSAPAPEPVPVPEPVSYAAPAPTPVVDEPAPTPATKKIKLRCGGCKEVFSIEDTGERPLKRACPSCGRMGMIR
jgi:predicted  nucleic acid-binding Zn-ribbon protein